MYFFPHSHMEDKTPAQGVDPSPEELADLTPPDPTELSPSTPEGGDTPPEKAAEELDPFDQLMMETGIEESTTPADPKTPPEEPMIPKSRLDEVIAQRNDLRRQNEAFLKLAAEKGLSQDERGNVVVKDTPQPEIPIENMTPKQMQQAKLIVQRLLADELSRTKKLEAEFASLKSQQQQAEEERKKAETEAAVREDRSKMEAAVKKHGGYTVQQVEAQVKRWLESPHADIRAMAYVPYPVILQQMDRMKAIREQRKSATPPAIPAGSPGGDLPTPSSAKPKRLGRPQGGKQAFWGDSLAKAATRFASEG